MQLSKRHWQPDSFELDYEIERAFTTDLGLHRPRRRFEGGFQNVADDFDVLPDPGFRAGTVLRPDLGPHLESVLGLGGLLAMHREEDEREEDVGVRF